MAEEKKPIHFVLVHGACHGAWCWFKLLPLLKEAGHLVTALDMSASGINMKRLDDLHTFSDYNQPLMDLMELIPPEEKVVLVGHSLGGMNLAFAMEKYHDKISLAVFVAAILPKTGEKPSFIVDKYYEWIPEGWMQDSQTFPFGSPEDNLIGLLLGPLYVSKMYENCLPQDEALAHLLLRPTSLFLEDLSKQSPFSTEGYGSVKRAYVIATNDKSVPTDFQRWQVENIGTTISEEIKDSDHMVMVSKPHQLCQFLLEVAN